MEFLSHIEVCFDNSVTTSARVPVGGMVTDEAGQPIARAVLTIQNMETLETQSVVTNTFGNYRFENLEVGNLYIVTVSNKKYTFSPDSQFVVLNDAVGDLNFSAAPQ